MYSAPFFDFLSFTRFIQVRRQIGCNTMFGEGLALTPTLSHRERGFAPFSLREKGWG